MRILRKGLWVTGMVAVPALLVLLLAGCTEVLNEYYISNHTDAEIQVRFTPFYTETVDVATGPLIEEMGTRPRGLLPDTVDYELVDGEEVVFSLGPRRTAFLGFSMGGNELFSDLELALGERRLSLQGSEQEEAFRVIDRFIGAVVHVLDVRDDMEGLE